MPYVFSLAFIMGFSGQVTHAQPQQCTANELNADLPEAARSTIEDCFKIAIKPGTLRIDCYRTWSSTDPATNQRYAYCQIRFRSRSGEPMWLKTVEELIDIPYRERVYAVSEKQPDNRCIIMGNGYRLSLIGAHQHPVKPYVCLLYNRYP